MSQAILPRVQKPLSVPAGVVWCLALNMGRAVTGEASTRAPKDKSGRSSYTCPNPGASATTTSPRCPWRRRPFGPHSRRWHGARALCRLPRPPVELKVKLRAEPGQSRTWEQAPLPSTIDVWPTNPTSPQNGRRQTQVTGDVTSPPPCQIRS